MFRCFGLMLLASTAFAVEEGDLVPRVELVKDLAIDQNHPSVRRVVAVEEGEISCQPRSQKLLVVHYRSDQTSRSGMKDDRLAIAVKQGDEFRVLKILESDTAVIDQGLYSGTDFDEEFILTGGIRFLHISTHYAGAGGLIMDEVYAISSDGQLSTVHFEEGSKLLRPEDQLRNGVRVFRDGVFSFESGIYRDRDGECCPSQGTLHQDFKLVGDFEEDRAKHVFRPAFKFVMDKESRSNSR